MCNSEVYDKGIAISHQAMAVSHGEEIKAKNIDEKNDNTKKKVWPET